MGKLEKRVASMRRSPANQSFDDVLAVCRVYFGAPRQTGGSHVVFAMPWEGDPRVNIQNRKGMVPAYQVRQVLAAIDRWEEGR